MWMDVLIDGRREPSEMKEVVCKEKCGIGEEGGGSRRQVQK